MNAGSSSTKCSIVDVGEASAEPGEPSGISPTQASVPGDEPGRDQPYRDTAYRDTAYRDVLVRNLPPPGTPSLSDALSEMVASYSPEASAHRIVHGGTLFTKPILLDPLEESKLADLADLAPLHNPAALALIDKVRSLAPDIPSVGCFDTAFFATMPPAARAYAVPEHWTRALGIRRYGFHGLSHQWASQRTAELLGADPYGLRIVSAHLGSGASLAAVVGASAVDTTMGFTPLEGLVMATRSGSLDPGVILHLIQREGMEASAVEEALEHESGLLGLSGHADLAKVIDGAAAGDERCILAWELYLHRLCAAIAAMVSAMGGVDVLTFTAGAGEGSAALRREVCQHLSFLGFELDAGKNEHASGDRIISLDAPAPAAEAPRRMPAAAVVHAREDLIMARQAARLLGGGGVSVGH